MATKLNANKCQNKQTLHTCFGLCEVAATSPACLLSPLYLQRLQRHRQAPLNYSSEGVHVVLHDCHFVFREKIQETTETQLNNFHKEYLFLLDVLFWSDVLLDSFNQHLFRETRENKDKCWNLYSATWHTLHIHTRGWHCSPLQGVGGGVWGGDTLRTYCTEDTPASISHAASISDLSTLSIPGEEPRKERHASGQRPSLNDSGDNSSDNDNLLEQCIQSAMPKVSPPKNHHCFSLLCSLLAMIPITATMLCFTLRVLSLHPLPQR